MNGSPYLNTVPLRHPRRLAASLLGTALLLLGGVHLAERLVAHLTLWSGAVPVPGLLHLALAAAGAVTLALVLRHRHGTHPQNR
ncbi:MAG: hypothetical protein JF597_29475 [Streptomyces sp.]|uniref:hypothetical protein n=1 Tax=Streptomyces sp. TaxID=1931 RepID=UPI0025F74745|nr:hypothetical protein [Streptomyces sp.]MBW8797561.1 hypothetical protein [Streptomyces sp.]